MIDMIKAEWQKIFCRKSTVFLLFTSFLMIVLYFFAFVFSYNEGHYNTSVGKVEYSNGYEAIELRKQVADKFSGVFDDSKVAEMQSEINDVKASVMDQNEDTIFSATYPYRDQQSILNYLTNANGSLQSVSQRYSLAGNISLGYCDGWNKLISAMGSLSSILICLIIVICISPVFAEEYSTHTDSVLCSARFGKSKLIRAKMIASYCSIAAILIGIVTINLLLYCGIYGFDGWNVSIQSSLHYATSNYNMTFGQLFLATLGLYFIGTVALTTLTLFLSAKLNSPVTALISSCVISFIPVFFDFSDAVPILQKIIELCPIYLLYPNGIFSKTQESLGISQPIIMAVVGLIIIVLSYRLTFLSFSKHQVTN